MLNEGDVLRTHVAIFFSKLRQGQSMRTAKLLTRRVAVHRNRRNRSRRCVDIIVEINWLSYEQIS